MNAYSFFSEFFIRLRMESPFFFKKLQCIFYILAGIAEFFVGLKELGFTLPEFTDHLISQGSAVVLFMAGIFSRLPVREPDELKEALKKKTGD
jgi:hypothetical protein